MAWAYSLTLSSPQLANLLQNLESNFGQAILEDVACLRFVGVARPPEPFRFDDNFDPGKWERGRAFGEEMELRWRRRGNEYAALLIAESPLILADDPQTRVSLPAPTSLSRDEELQQVILWGEWQDPEEEDELPDPNRHWWYEERIPQFLDYPWINEDSRLALRVARYRAPSPPGFPGDFIYRFVGLTAMRAAAASQQVEEPEEEIAEYEEDADD